jgi:hypothetical protein
VHGTRDCGLRASMMRRLVYDETALARYAGLDMRGKRNPRTLEQYVALDTRGCRNSLSASECCGENVPPAHRCVYCHAVATIEAERCACPDRLHCDAAARHPACETCDACLSSTPATCMRRPSK